MKIIIVDQSISSMNQLAKRFEHFGIKTEAMTNEKSEILRLIDEYVPDLVLLDIALINNEFRDYIKHITTERHIPIIILSSDSVQDTAKTVFAITNGASDYIIKSKLESDSYLEEAIRKMVRVKPSAQHKFTSKKKHNQQHSSREMEKRKQQPSEKTKQEKQETLKKIEQQRTDEHEQQSIVHPPEKSSLDGSNAVRTIIAIGTSTGGPRALQKVLRKFPKNFPVPIVIVQHMPSGFTKSLANRLNETCNICVKEAEEGEKLQAGTAYIAPGNYHMTVSEHSTIHVFNGPERLGHRPSVNILLESLTKLSHTKKYVVILTGMGKDGAEGIKTLKEADEQTTIVIESEESAIIFGMPRAALETGHVNYQFNIDELGDKLIDFIMKRGK